jgi:hypothetical protein
MISLLSRYRAPSEAVRYRARSHCAKGSEGERLAHPRTAALTPDNDTTSLLDRLALKESESFTASQHTYMACSVFMVASSRVVVQKLTPTWVQERQKRRQQTQFCWVRLRGETIKVVGRGVSAARFESEQLSILRERPADVMHEWVQDSFTYPGCRETEHFQRCRHCRKTAC